MKLCHTTMLCIALAACSTTVATYSECLITPNAVITEEYCEHKAVRFIKPVVSPQLPVSSSQKSKISSQLPVASSQSSVASSKHSVTSNQKPVTSVRLQVPFTPQAPTANWDPPFDESCEEASYLMVEYMLQGKTFTAQTATTAIAEFVEYQTANGYAVDIAIEDLAKVVKQKFARNTTVFTGDQVNVQQIELLLASGYPVIIPAAGKLLGNPYFTGDGPPYHMLVITGYDVNNFITNDPGTKRGEGFMYKKDHLVRVIHNWNGSIHTIESGPKAMMIVLQ